jgi:hypothetical protein
MPVGLSIFRPSGIGHPYTIWIDADEIVDGASTDQARDDVLRLLANMKSRGSLVMPSLIPTALLKEDLTAFGSDRTGPMIPVLTRVRRLRAKVGNQGAEPGDMAGGALHFLGERGDGIGVDGRAPYVLMRWVASWMSAAIWWVGDAPPWNLQRPKPTCAVPSRRAVCTVRSFPWLRRGCGRPHDLARSRQNLVDVQKSRHSHSEAASLPSTHGTPSDGFPGPRPAQ